MKEGDFEIIIKINTMKNALVYIGFLFLLVSMVKPKPVQVVIKTSAECNDCKVRIEEKLNYTKGIVFSDLDFKKQELTVKFRSDKITLEQIKKLVSELGYDADEVKANPEAQKKLPTCCQPGGMGHDH